MPTDSPLQSLLTSLDFEEDEVVDRHKVSTGLQRLGMLAAHLISALEQNIQCWCCMQG